jgi:hypothetical protein
MPATNAPLCTLAIVRHSLLQSCRPFLVTEVLILEGEITSIESWLRQAHEALGTYQRLVEDTNAGVRAFILRLHHA